MIIKILIFFYLISLSLGNIIFIQLEDYSIYLEISVHYIDGMQIADCSACLVEIFECLFLTERFVLENMREQIPMRSISKYNINHRTLLETVIKRNDVLVVKLTMNAHLTLYPLDFLHTTHAAEIHLKEKYLKKLLIDNDNSQKDKIYYFECIFLLSLDVLRQSDFTETAHAQLALAFSRVSYEFKFFNARK